MRKLYCDRCGVSDSEVYVVASAVRLHVLYAGLHEIKDVDLCKPCYLKIREKVLERVK